MPWGALSGARLVRGLKRVFWGRGGGVRAAVAQYLRYLQIHAIPKHTYIYIQSDTDTYEYLPIPSIMCRYLLVCAGIVGICRYFKKSTYILHYLVVFCKPS